jgi:hypothetical protein
MEVRSVLLLGGRLVPAPPPSFSPFHTLKIRPLTIYRALEEHCHNSKNTTFQERETTTGQGDAFASKEQRDFFPLADILENRRVTLFH